MSVYLELAELKSTELHGMKLMWEENQDPRIHSFMLFLISPDVGNNINIA